jgi:hypothetical protein
MADYNGTDEDDLIDASTLDSDVNNIYPGKGNDTVTNATSKHTIIASPGEDNISGEKFGYALWNATQAVTINLKEGWSEDGFGTRDTISGIETIHGSSFGDMVQKIMKNILLTVVIILSTVEVEAIELPMLLEEAHQLILK